jgi:hypothetical protein
MQSPVNQGWDLQPTIKMITRQPVEGDLYHENGTQYKTRFGISWKQYQLLWTLHRRPAYFFLPR